MVSVHATGQAEPACNLEIGFFPIRVASLCVDTVIAFDLYLPPHPDRRPVLYREKNLPFTAEALARLDSSSVHELFVSSSQAGEYHRYVEANLRNVLADENLPVTERSGVLYSSAMHLARDLLADHRAGDTLARSTSLVENAVWFIFNQEEAVESLIKVTSYDYYTYTHSVDVLVFSVALAKALGFDETIIVELGNGAVLHDLGKCLIDPAILNQAGKLTAEQWAIMKFHPVYGYNILRSQGVGDGIILDVVRHHHEKRTGRGYPDGLTEDDLSPFTRMSAIADIFSALTTRRSYKDALSSFAALKLMQEEMMRELDARMFRAFVELLGHLQLQPMGVS